MGALRRSTYRSGPVDASCSSDGHDSFDLDLRAEMQLLAGNDRARRSVIAEEGGAGLVRFAPVGNIRDVDCRLYDVRTRCPDRARDRLDIAEGVRDLVPYCDRFRGRRILGDAELSRDVKGVAMQDALGVVSERCRRPGIDDAALPGLRVHCFSFYQPLIFGHVPTGSPAWTVQYLS